MALRIRGNKLVAGFSDESQGETARLCGVSLQDPLWQRLSPGPRMLPHGTINLEQAKTWGANTVRVPFHPATIRHAGGGDWPRGLEEVAKELDWILLAAKALGLWVIIDFHSIGFPADGSTFDFEELPYEALYDTDQYEIEAFWRMVARRYHDHPAVAAFELFNEATRDSAFGNAKDWDEHAAWTERLLSEIIRPQAPNVVAIIGGLHFGYDLEGALTRPVRDQAIAYSSHPYPHHSQAKSWDSAFGALSERHPVLLTEVGFASEGFFGRGHHRGFRDWELELRSFADARELSFIAWNFSGSWEPTLLVPQNENPDFASAFQPNEAGTFFQDWMRRIASEKTTTSEPQHFSSSV